MTQRHVLSAAHCFSSVRLFPSFVTAVVGAHTVGTGRLVDISAITLHPNFGHKAAFDSDLAILTLAQDVTFNARVAPLCLPSISSSQKTLAEDSNVVVLGWVHTSERVRSALALRQVQLRLLSDSSCALYGHRFTDAMLCVGSALGGADACQGDSGGPLLQEVDGVFLQVGIVSFGRGCGRKEFPGIYTKVDNFVEWIKSVL